MKMTVEEINKVLKLHGLPVLTLEELYNYIIGCLLVKFKNIPEVCKALSTLIKPINEDKH